MELNQQKLERDYSKTNDITGADYARTLVVCIIQVSEQVGPEFNGQLGQRPSHSFLRRQLE